MTIPRTTQWIAVALASDALGLAGCGKGEEPEISEDMSVSEASEIISELISIARQNGVVVQRQINEPRLGMAMKECFRQWTALGKNIHDERRKAFIDYTIDTYNFFTEIPEKLGQDAQAQ